MPLSNQTRFGHTVTLLGARGPTESQRILDLKLDEIAVNEQYKPGAWVLSMQAENAANQTVTGGVVQVQATIRIGSGGATVPCAVSVIHGTSLQLPAAAITVDVNLLGVSSVDMRVSAIVQRGFSNQSAHLIQSVTMTNATTPQRGLVPNFARYVRVIADPNNQIWTNEVNWSWGDGFNNMWGRQMRELMVRGEKFPVVPGTTWTINSKPSAAMINYPSAAFELDWEIAI